VGGDTATAYTSATDRQPEIVLALWELAFADGLMYVTPSGDIENGNLVDTAVLHC
jgi:hypothetical protein